MSRGALVQSSRLGERLDSTPMRKLERRLQTNARERSAHLLPLGSQSLAVATPAETTHQTVSPRAEPRTEPDTQHGVATRAVQERDQGA